MSDSSSSIDYCCIPKNEKDVENVRFDDLTEITSEVSE